MATPTLPTPGRGLKAVLLLLLGLWVALAVAVNWGGASPELVGALVGDTGRMLSDPKQLYRLFTAPLVHAPSGNVSHVLGTLLGLYFLGSSLEESFGTRRFLRFLAITAVVPYAVQLAVVAVVPASVADRLAGPVWLGAWPAVTAVSVAWALSFQHAVVRLFFLLPVTGRTLLWLVVGLNVAMLLAVEANLHGRVSPFVAMALGWALGGSTPSPLRRVWLRFRLDRLEREARSEAAARARKAGLRVLPGGGGKGAPSDRGGGSHLH